MVSVPEDLKDLILKCAKSATGGHDRPKIAASMVIITLGDF